VNINNVRMMQLPDRTPAWCAAVPSNIEPNHKEITMSFLRVTRAATAVVALGALSSAAAETNSEIAGRLIDKQSTAVPACALLSDQEITKMTGRPSYTKAEGVQLKNGGSSCTWDSGVNINLFSGPRSAEQHEDFLKAFKQDKTPRQTVSGLGDSAYATAWMGNQYQGNHAVLVVRKGVHTMGISLQAEGGETPQSVQPKLIAVAKAALAKLP
jgi:hypothetical protein